jgi:hypothetical protein
LFPAAVARACAAPFARAAGADSPDADHPQEHTASHRSVARRRTRARCTRVTGLRERPRSAPPAVSTTPRFTRTTSLMLPCVIATWQWVAPGNAPRDSNLEWPPARPSQGDRRVPQNAGRRLALRMWGLAVRQFRDARSASCAAGRSRPGDHGAWRWLW